MRSVEYVGPFKRWDVVVDGRKVPYLQGRPCNGGRVDLGLDHRYGLILDVATADRVVPFLADAIAIAMGLTCHPRLGWDGPEPLPPFPRATALGDFS
jgi:hypothetical protein